MDGRDGEGRDQDKGFHNVDAEYALLGAMLIDNRVIGNVSERVKGEDFFDPLHGRMFHAIVRLAGMGKTVSPITLVPMFQNDAGFEGEASRARDYLVGMTSSSAALIGARDFADQIAELSRMRSIHRAMEAALGKFQQGEPIADAIQDLEAEIWRAADVHRPIRVLDAGEMIGLAQERIDKIQLQATASVGAMCRTIPELNSLLGGLEAAQYTILAGRPSMGKTTTALSAAWGYAANGHPTLYCHAEMSSELIALKVASDISFSRGKGILFETIKKGQTTRTENQWLDEAKELAAQLPLRYADIGRADILRLDSIIARQCAYWKSQGRRLEVVFIDYIGLLQVEGVKAGDDRARVSRISKALLDMAAKYGVHIVALAQLSRALESRTDKRPMLSDLRDSGDLEQDADMVVFVYRHEWYHAKEKPKRESEVPDWEIEMAECAGKVEIIAEKNRLGQRGYRKARFFGDYSAVRSLTSRGYVNDDDEYEGEDLFANWGTAG
jgi:replicative DNA helicase